MQTRTSQILAPRVSSIVSKRQSVTNADALVNEICDSILGGIISPGDFIGSERDISENFDVSRNTAREALRSLAAMGAVEIRVGVKGGASIAKGNANAIGKTLAIQHCLIGVPEDEVLEVQSVLEGLAAERAAEYATLQDIEKLEMLLDEATQFIHDPIEFSNSSRKFHAAIADAAHSQALSMQLSSLRHVIWPPHNTFPKPNVAKNVIKSHRILLGFIKGQDAAGAHECMRDHIEHIRNQHRKIREKGSVKETICC